MKFTTTWALGLLTTASLLLDSSQVRAQDPAAADPAAAKDPAVAAAEQAAADAEAARIAEKKANHEPMGPDSKAYQLVLEQGTMNWTGFDVL